MSGDDYVGVTATLRARTAKAVLLDVGEEVSRGSWIPRSCLYGPDDSAVDNVAIDSTVTLRMFEWIANREGLI